MSIGANLPGFDGKTPLQTCLRAVEQIASLPGLRLESVSRWYETRPLPPSGQPPYVNGVVSLSGKVRPERLLGLLHDIETDSGRLRGEPNAARTLDLDVIAMGALVREAPDPILPHPRAHLREFVLRPLADVAPGWVHPKLGLTAAQLLEALPPQGVRLIG